ncbi:MAG: hypothetical protein N2038_15775, partial [Geminicoccaceae bacterium]|nr:hypothetical protein [Geminicoccaceae bacterium]
MNKFAQVLRRMTQTEAEAFVSQTMQAIMGAAGNPFTPVQSGGTKLRLGAGADRQRPTTNSNGQPIHPTEEGVRNFWKWFGDSKVVDDQGRPLVVYHGTTRDFSAFDPNAPRTALPLPGMFFTPHAVVAESYASFGKEIRDDDGFIIGAEGGNVMPVYLSLQNPA